MNKLEYFGKVIKVVTELIEVEEKDIISGSRAIEAVDARWLIIRLMKDRGYSSKQIAPLLNRSIRSITHALLYFESRTEDPFCALGNIYEIAKQHLRNT